MEKKLEHPKNLLLDLIFTLWGIFPREMKGYVHSKSWTKIFIVPLLVMAQIVNILKGHQYVPIHYKEEQIIFAWSIDEPLKSYALQM
jgi:hypothetical protein